MNFKERFRGKIGAISRHGGIDTPADFSPKIQAQLGGSVVLKKRNLNPNSRNLGSSASLKLIRVSRPSAGPACANATHDVPKSGGVNQTMLGDGKFDRLGEDPRPQKRKLLACARSDNSMRVFPQLKPSFVSGDVKDSQPVGKTRLSSKFSLQVKNIQQDVASCCCTPKASNIEVLARRHFGEVTLPNIAGGSRNVFFLPSMKSLPPAGEIRKPGETSARATNKAAGGLREEMARLLTELKMTKHSTMKGKAADCV
ncbi:MAG: hypothetical protein P4M11_03855 [Candidatus Pacebacteria bacterium]|nr:hypothetical protein [Candidatus Paceibacterota bacterium]